MKPKTQWERDVSLEIAGLCEAYSRTATPATFHAYALGLDGLEITAIRVAVTTALKTCKFMPTPAELREMAGEMRADDRAIHAWIALERAVCSVGHVRGVDFSDRVVNAAVRALGGWDRVCQLEGDEFDVFLRKRFIDTYVALSRSGVGDEQAAPLEGAFDRENRRMGFAPKPPLRIETSDGSSRPGVAHQQVARAVPRVNLKRPEDL